MRNRPWFALMAITALKTGSKLPIETWTKNQKVQFIPSELASLEFEKNVYTPEPLIITEKSSEKEIEPEVYDIY